MRLDPTTFLATCGPWAVVTGASSGIGAQFCKSLAELGFNVVLVARRAQRLHTLAAQIRQEHGIQTQVIVADLSNADGVLLVANETGKLDVGLLVLNAGTDMLGAYLGYSAADVQHLLSVNVTSVATLASTVGRAIARRGRGGVIFVSSIGARPTPYMAAYGASKAFVSALALALHEEWQVHGVQILVFEPGVVHSEMADRFIAATGDKLRLSSVSAEKAVNKALRTLGRRANCTIGVRNAIYRRIADWMPHSIQLPNVAAHFRQTLPADFVDVAL